MTAPSITVTQPLWLRERFGTRRAAIGAFCVVVGLIAAALFSLRVAPGTHTRVALNGGAAIHLPSPNLSVRWMNLVLAAIAVACGVRLLTTRVGRHTYVLLGLSVFAATIALLIWAARGSQVDLEAVFVATFVDSVPLVFASMSGVICERSGVINIAIEGQLLTGAFLAAMIGSVTGNLWIGLVAGGVGGLALALVLALLCLRFTADQIFAGFVLITLAQGLTSYLALQVMGPNLNLNSPATFKSVGIPLLDRIPVIGPLLFDQSAMFYLAAALVVGMQIMLFRTRIGLHLRAVGERPRAAEIAGIDVLRLRWWTVCIGGVFGGLGGAALTIGGAGEFEPLMSSGLGFIGLAAMILGRWNPIGAVSACLAFAFADSLQSHLAILNVSIPPPFLIMLPYVLTIAVVGGLAGRVRAPGAAGVPYVRQ